MTDTRDPANAGKQADSSAAAPYMDQMVGSWQAMSSVWTAWLEAADNFSRERGVKAAMSFERLFDPQFWKAGELTPLLEELQQALSLPQLADVPKPDLSMLGASAGMFDLTGLINRYVMMSIPMWLSASQNFQAEVAARASRGEPVKSPGDALDLWNSVCDRTLMEFSRSGDFAEIQQRLLRASAQFRLELRKIGERGARLFDTPTRTELTDIYRRMHDMQREIHSLRREVGRLRSEASRSNTRATTKKQEARNAE